MTGQLFTSGVRAKVLELLYGPEENWFHNREIARFAGFSESSVRKELHSLRDMDLLLSKTDGNRTCYMANRQHPLYPELSSIILKTSGTPVAIARALKGEDIVAAFIFGSFAAGTLKAASDIDLMIIGTLGMRKTVRLLNTVQGRIGRDVNPHVLTPLEYAAKVRSNDHFLTSVMSETKFFIIGSEDELAGLAE